MTHLTITFRRIVALLGAVLVLGAPLRAQQPTQLVGIAPAGDPNEVVSNFFMALMPLEDVLQQLELLTGRSVIRTESLPKPTITFNNGMQRQQFTKAELVIAIESLLSINGIGLTPLGDKFIKVVPLGQVQQEAPELVIGSLLEVQASGKIVSKLFRLQYLDPQQFQLQLGAFLSLGKVATFQNSNTVIVTDTISNLQRVEMLLVEIDRRLNIETKFYQIEYASAADLAQSIRAMIDSAKSGSSGGRVVVQQGGAPGGAAPGVAVSAGAQQIVLSTNTAINADERTNQLIIITDPANIPFFDDMIAKLDVPADPPTAIEVIPMQHADAEELAGLLSELVSGRSQRSSSGGDRQAGASRANQMRPTFQTGSPAVNATPERQQAAQSAVQNVLEASGSQFSEVMTIIADTRSNAVIVSGTNNDLALIKGVISQLDILLAQVRIEVVIAEVTLGNGYARGIDAFQVNYSEVERAAVGEPGDDDYQPALSAGELLASGSFGPITGIISGITGNGGLDNVSIDAIVASGRTNSDVNVLSVPTITTLHNKEATFIAGESRPLITGSVNNGQVGGTTSTVQYQDIAIELVVTPKVGPNNVIELEIDQKVDDVGEEVEIDGNKQPAIIRRQATSTVSVQDGQLIVLGGLQRSRITHSRNRMFILGDIPLLDTIFSRKVESTQKVELLVFIKPTVVRTMEAADADARQMINQVHVNEDSARLLEKITGTPHVPDDAPVEDKSGPAKPKRPANR